MTYEMSLNNVGFAELTRDEMLCVDGGEIDWLGIGCAVMGLIPVAGPIFAVYTYVVGSVMKEAVKEPNWTPDCFVSCPF